MQAQQATALWSIALAAAVMGLVILGHQWQHEHCQNQQLQLQLCSKDEVLAWKLLLFFKKTNEHLRIIDVHPVIRLVLRKGNLEIADSLFSLERMLKSFCVFLLQKISHLTLRVVCLREAMLGHHRVQVLRSSSVYHTF